VQGFLKITTDPLMVSLNFASFFQRFSLSLYKALKESTEKLHLINAKKKLNEE